MLRLGWEALKAFGLMFAFLAMLMVGGWAFILAVAVVIAVFSDDTIGWSDLKEAAMYLGVSLILAGLIAVVVAPIAVVGDRRRARRLRARPLERPWTVAASCDGATFVGEPGRNRLTRHRSAEVVELDASVLGYGPIAPYAVVVRDADVYVADPLQGIVVLAPGEGDASAVGLGLPEERLVDHHPVALALEHDGSLLVADSARRRLLRVRGEAVELAAECRAAVRGIAILSDGRIAITDRFGDQVLALSPDGEFQPIVGTGERGRSADGRPGSASMLAGPTGLAAAPDGRLFVADTMNHRVAVLEADRTLSTFAGTGRAGFAGDGGAAREALLSAPRGLALTEGGLLIADTGNDRIRLVNADGTIRTVVGDPPGDAEAGRARS